MIEVAFAHPLLNKDDTCKRLGGGYVRCVAGSPGVLCSDHPSVAQPISELAQVEWSGKNIVPQVARIEAKLKL